MHVCLCRRLSTSFSCRARAWLAAVNPQYFEYQIGRGVEWIQIYSPGIWRPVPDDAPVLLHASTYWEWRRSYHHSMILGMIRSALEHKDAVVLALFCKSTLGCLAWWCAFRLCLLATFLCDFERLAGLKCSIVQCMVQHDGSCLATLTTTSSMGQQIQVWNGFGSMYRVSGIQSRTGPG